jgi:hypothetical protein
VGTANVSIDASSADVECGDFEGKVLSVLDWFPKGK